MDKKAADLPVQKNDELIVKIEGLNAEGQGIARIDGYVLFVPYALAGEEVKIHVIKAGGKFGVAKAAEIIKASDRRVTPVCPHFGRCGGCSLQHMAYDAQLAFKTEMVREAFLKIAKVAVAVNPAVGTEVPWRYRNKASFVVKHADDGLYCGFYRIKSHDIVDVEDCFLQRETAVSVMHFVKRWAMRYAIGAYDEQSGTGLLRHVVLRITKRGDLMLCLVINGSGISHAAELLEVCDAFPAVKSVVLNKNTQKTNRILGREEVVLFGESRLPTEIGGVGFGVSAQSFFQVNDEIATRIYQQALSYLNDGETGSVIDAYCGAGTLSLQIAKRGIRVLGIDSEKKAVEDARQAARANGLDASFICGLVENELPKLIKSKMKIDAIVLDPPRKGIEKAVIDAIIKVDIRRIVYISCNPRTLSRDAAFLLQQGYAIKSIQPFDMFPQTDHVETCVLLSHKNS